MPQELISRGNEKSGGIQATYAEARCDFRRRLEETICSPVFFPWPIPLLVVLLAGMILSASATTARAAARPDLILMSQSGGLVGGRSERTQVLAIEQSGVAQAWIETSDDKLLDVRAGRIDPRHLFASASQVFHRAEESVPPAGSSTPELLPEYFPARLWIRVRQNGQERSWLGAKESLPPVWSELFTQLLAVREGSGSLKPSPYGRYLRCEELAGTAAGFLREAGLIQDLSPAELSARPLVREAISKGPAPVPIPDQTNPLDGLRQPKGDPTRTHLSVQGHCYLIRVLTYNPNSGQAPGKETSK